MQYYFFPLEGDSATNKSHGGWCSLLECKRHNANWIYPSQFFLSYCLNPSVNLRDDECLIRFISKCLWGCNQCWLTSTLTQGEFFLECSEPLKTLPKICFIFCPLLELCSLFTKCLGQFIWNHVITPKLVFTDSLWSKMFSFFFFFNIMLMVATTNYDV